MENGGVCGVSSYILKYSRDERVKYISHLDFIRLFHRTVRRADIPFVFSQGFNPHPIMTVSQPLSVGVTSDCEYMKVGFDGDFSNEELCDRINAAFPPGYTLLVSKKLDGKEIDITKINRAEYIVETEYSGNFDIDAFMTNTSLIVMKKTKSGEKESDIRPYIYDMTVADKNDTEIVFDMTLAIGNEYNLKPQTVLDAMEKYTEGLKFGFSKLHRKNMTINGNAIL